MKIIQESPSSIGWVVQIAQWFFVSLTGILIAYFFRNLVIGDLLNSIIAICMLVLATLVALGYNKLRGR